MRLLAFASLILASQIAQAAPAGLDCKLYRGTAEFDSPSLADWIFAGGAPIHVSVTIPEKTGDLFQLKERFGGAYQDQTIRLDLENREVSKRLREWDLSYFGFTSEDCKKEQGYPSCVKTLSVARERLLRHRKAVRGPGVGGKLNKIDCALEYIAKFQVAIDEAHYLPVVSPKNASAKSSATPATGDAIPAAGSSASGQ